MTNVVESTIGVLCVDDHSLVRKGIASILANEPDLRLLGEARNGTEAVEAFSRLRPDVTLMDLRMPEMDGVEATKRIRRLDPEARIIALTSYDGDQEIYRSLEAGVRGYLLKEMLHTAVVSAIRVVHSGKRLMPSMVVERLSEYFPQIVLTPREIEVLEYVAKGLGNRQIGEQLGITLWETEGDSAQAINTTLLHAMKSGTVKPNDAADPSTAELTYWEPITPYITREDFAR